MPKSQSLTHLAVQHAQFFTQLAAGVPGRAIHSTCVTHGSCCRRLPVNCSQPGRPGTRQQRVHRQRHVHAMPVSACTMSRWTRSPHGGQKVALLICTRSNRANKLAGMHSTPSTSITPWLLSPPANPPPIPALGFYTQPAAASWSRHMPEQPPARGLPHQPLAKAAELPALTPPQSPGTS